ncbi:MAG: hypothetical protein WCT49_06820 [Candidatus Paceibacterota bacterium]|jgi:hypothetical protein|nr:hypothetical protein [Candidatus Paceibacterota bacterium]
MNALSLILTIANASLFAGGLLGLFLDIPARSNLASKERVQTALMRSISDRDNEVVNMQKRREELEIEIPLMPEKIEEAKNNLVIRKADLARKIREERSVTAMASTTRTANE